MPLSFQRHAAGEQGVSEQEAPQKGMGEKSREFVEKGSEIYAKASIGHIGPKTSVKRYFALGHPQSGASVQDRSDTFQTG